MAHVGQEIGFGAACLFCLQARLFKFFLRSMDGGCILNDPDGSLLVKGIPVNRLADQTNPY